MPTTPIQWTINDLEFLASDRSRRYEIIEGELLVTRAPHWKHQNACINIGTLLKLWSDKSGLGETAIAPGIIFSESDSVIPDVVWVSRERLEQVLDKAGHLIGAPELIVEVLSPGEENEKRDKETKLKLYSARGVREYWIVNRQQQTVEVYRRENAALKFTVTLFSQDELTSPLLPGFSCLVSQFF